MRVFIAVELSKKIKEELKTIQQEVKKAASAGKFTSFENFHLTIHFIGEVNSEDYDKIKSAMDKAAENIPAFQLNLNGLGSFKKKNREIIWIGVKGELDTLQCLNKEVVNRLNSFSSKEPEADYTPHVTLGRQVRLNTSINILNEALLSSGWTLPVKSISLMESKRLNGKLVYESVYKVRLSG